MAKIKKITKKQQKFFDNLIQKYLDDITNFPPMDEEKSKEAVYKMYEAMGCKKPVVIIGKNPYETALMCWMLQLKSSPLKLELGSQLDSQLHSQLDSQLDSQLRSQLNSQLNSQLYTQFVSQLEPHLRSQLDSQLKLQLDSHLRIQLYSQLRSQLYLQLGSQLDSQLGSQLHSQLYSQLNSQLDSQLGSINNNWYQCLWWRFWDCYYQFGREIGVQFDNDKLTLFNKFLTHVYFCIPYDGICFISEPPIKSYWNDKKQLHREGEAAIEFKSSIDEPTFGVWSLNGVRVPKYLAETPAGSLDIEFFKKEQNADIKAEFIRKYGIERMVSMGKLIDTWGNHENTKNFEWYKKSEYKLIDMSSLFTRFDYLPYLYMKNQTIDGIYHLECCYNPEAKKQPKTILEALKVRLNGVDPESVEITAIA